MDSTLDAADQLFQVWMDECSKDKTAFWTPWGLFQFRVMPFGLKGAPATFQNMLDRVVGNAKGSFAEVLMDDIVVFSDTFMDHMEHARCVFKRLKDNRIFLKPEKCELLRRKVEFLGLDMSLQGVTPTQDKAALSRTGQHQGTGATSNVSSDFRIGCENGFGVTSSLASRHSYGVSTDTCCWMRGDMI